MAIFDANNIGRWKLSGGVWTDTGGQGNAYTLTANGTVGQVAGHGGLANGAASFNNADGADYLTHADTALLSVTGAFSAAGWAYVGSTSENAIIASKSLNTGNQEDGCSMFLLLQI